MKVLSPVVWHEGMHLAQHHFQLQSRYFEDATAFTVSAVRPHGYGLTHLELDAEALGNGSVVLLGARGIMPDGLAFDFSVEEPPAALSIRETFSPTREGQVVALSVPAYRPGRANGPTEEGDHADLRYGTRIVERLDETSGMDQKPVGLAAKNFQLVLDPPKDERHVTLPLARVVRAGSGAFSYDPAFVPPCLQVGGSDRLLSLLRRFVEVLEQRAQTLRQERGRRDDGMAEYASREVMGFWLTHSIQSTLAVLRHLYESRTAHPERLYLELARLAGALCTFSTELTPSAIPLYDHADLGGTFGDLDRFIRRGLEVILPRGATRVALIPVLQQRALAEVDESQRSIAPFVYSGDLQDPRAYTPRAQWYLGVRSDLSGAETARHVLKLVKFGSERVALWMGGRAHSGMPLEHLPTPPAELSARADTQYFRIAREETHWAQIVKEKRVGAYAPSALVNVEIDVLVVDPSDPS